MKLLAIVLLVTVTWSISVEPNTPIWGGALAYQVKVNMTDVSDAPEHPQWFFNYHYMADLKHNATYARYDMEQGQHDEVCKGIEGAPALGARCSVLHGVDNWMIINYPDDSFCCKCTQNIGAVRYDWLRTGLSKYEGRVEVDGNGEPFPGGHEADAWFEQGASGNHYYATSDNKQAPIRYMEFKNNKLKQWDFLEDTYRVRYDWMENDVLPSVFQAPNNCDTRCKVWFCT